MLKDFHVFKLSYEFYIRNSSDFANKRRNLQKIHYDEILVPLDVVSLYHIMLHDAILKTMI